MTWLWSVTNAIDICIKQMLLITLYSLILSTAYGVLKNALCVRELNNNAISTIRTNTNLLVTLSHFNNKVWEFTHLSEFYNWNTRNINTSSIGRLQAKAVQHKYFYSASFSHYADSRYSKRGFARTSWTVYSSTLLKTYNALTRANDILSQCLAYPPLITVKNWFSPKNAGYEGLTPTMLFFCISSRFDAKVIFLFNTSDAFFFFIRVYRHLVTARSMRRKADALNTKILSFLNDD